MGFQTAGSPLMAYWSSMCPGIRDCNIFLENVDKVVDLEPYMRTRWIGEVDIPEGLLSLAPAEDVWPYPYCR